MMYGHNNGDYTQWTASYHLPVIGSICLIQVVGGMLDFFGTKEGVEHFSDTE